MVAITCYIKPHVLEGVKTAIADCGVSGISVSDVRGCGNSEQTDLRQGMRLAMMSKIRVVVPNELTDQVIQAILDNAQTGQPGDGKIFIEKISDVIRIRTFERGETAV